MPMCGLTLVSIRARSNRRMPGGGSALSKGVCVPSHGVRHGARREFVQAGERPNVREYSCVIGG